MKSGIKRALLIGAIATAIAAVVLAASIGGSGKKKLPRLDYFTVKTQPLEEKVSGTGSFVPKAAATVYARVSGAVQRIAVEEGDRIRKGDLLLEIDRYEYEQNLEKAKVSLESTRRAALQRIVNLRANYSSALLSCTQAKRNYEKNRELFAAQAIAEDVLTQSEEAFETAEVNLQSAREQLNLETGQPLHAEPIMDPEKDKEILDRIPEVIQVKLSLDSARKALLDCSPGASMAGTVTQIIPAEGDIVSPNSPLVKIESLDRMIAEINIDEVDIGKIARGSPAEITSDSILGETLKGTVAAISPIIQKIGNTRISTVKIEIQDTGMNLKAGASCTARIMTFSRESALVIPLTAYTTEDENTIVYVLAEESDEGTGDASDDEQKVYVLKNIEITIGISTVNQVEVLSGLEEGDMVATGNLSLYREGLKVVLGEKR